MKMQTDGNENLAEEIGRLKKRIAQLEKIEKHNEDTLESIFRVAPAGIGMLRNRIFVETNPLVSEITGYSREELIGKSSRILYQNNQDFEYVGQEKYRQIKKFGTGTVETIWKRKDGVIIDIHLSSTPIDRSDMLQGVIFTALDITEQKKAKKALESSEDRLKVIFEHAPDALYLSDFKGNFIDGNIAVENLIGQGKEDLIGQNFLNSNLLRSKDYLKATENLAKNVSGLKTGPDTFRLKTKNGKSPIVEISNYPIVVGEKQMVLGIARDISERLKSERFRRESEQRMAFHVNQTPLAVIEWNLDFKIKSWNPAAETIFGYTPEEAIGKHGTFIIPEIEKPLVEGVLKEVVGHKRSRRNTNKNQHKNGDILVCDWYNTPLVNDEGNVIAIASLALDVTDQIRTDRIQNVIYNISTATNTTDNLNNLIRKIQGELSSIIDTTNFYIALYNKESQTLSLPLFADEKDKFSTFPTGKTLTSYVIRNKKPLLATKQVIDKLEQNGEIEVVGTNSEIWLGVPLKIEGEIIGVLAVQSYTNPHAYNEADLNVLKFVSDQISLSINKKNTELEMADALEKAKEADRLKSSFLANMSHEIRTPMNGILGFANLLKNEQISIGDRQNYISIIEKSGKRMLGVINDLIDISKIESGITEVVSSDFNLNNSIEYVYSFFKPEADTKGLELSFSTEFDHNKALIRSDREKVYAVLINLVKNAIKYTQTGSIHFSYTIRNKRIRFEVSDTGIGISTNQLKTVFNRFVQADFRLSSNYEGVGLGLAISKAYIQLLGGEIWVESELNKGSTFYFEIPYNKGKEIIKQETEKTTMYNDPKNKLKILVAEDDIINRKLFSYILKEISDELIMTNNGSEAVNKYDEFSDIDLILMDLKMPEMDGYEATRIIREKDSDIRIIALSAFAFETERKKALDGGFNDYVSKPISKLELFKTIGKYFEI